MPSSANQTEILLRVYPNAARNEVVGFVEGILRVRVSAPPVRGKANKELIAFISQCSGVGRERLRIVKGHTSGNKVIAIEGLTREELLKRLLPG